MQQNLTGIKYWGGKGRIQIRNWINSLLPQETNISYIEPFAGMLGILLARPVAKSEVINDLDGNITNWWTVVREQPKELEWLIQHTPCCRTTYEQCYDKLQQGEYNDDPIKQAWATFTVIQHSIVHSLGKKGFGVSYYGRNPQLGKGFIDKLAPLAYRLRNVQIENTDAMTILERTKNYDFAVIYCDPPYPTTYTSPYNNQDIDIDKMSQLLLQQQGRVAISGAPTEWDHLKWTRHDMNTKFSHVGENSEKEGNTRTECLWTNYQPDTQTLF